MYRLFQSDVTYSQLPPSFNTRRRDYCWGLSSDGYPGEKTQLNEIIASFVCPMTRCHGQETRERDCRVSCLDTQARRGLNLPRYMRCTWCSLVASQLRTFRINVIQSKFQVSGSNLSVQILGGSEPSASDGLLLGARLRPQAATHAGEYQHRIAEHLTSNLLE